MSDKLPECKKKPISIWWFLTLFTFPAVAIYLITWYILKLVGLRAWSVEEFTKIATIFEWHHTVTIGLITVLLIYKDSIIEFVKSIKTLSLGKDQINLERFVDGPFLKQQEVQDIVLDERPDQALTVEYVRSELAKIPAINQKTLDYSDKAHSYFLRNGISTKGRFKDLINSTYLMDTLKRIYNEELPKNRDPAAPLDPVAVATWGALLFVKGTEESVINQIRMLLRQSPEGILNRK